MKFPIYGKIKFMFQTTNQVNLSLTNPISFWFGMKLCLGPTLIMVSPYQVRVPATCPNRAGHWHVPNHPHLSNRLGGNPIMMVFTDVQKRLSNNWLALAQASYIEIYDFATRIHWIIVMFSPKRLRRKRLGPSKPCSKNQLGRLRQGPTMASHGFNQELNTLRNRFSSRSCMTVLKSLV
jgi:hypothetical protein